MTDTDTPTNREAIEHAEAMIAACRKRIDENPDLPPVVRRFAHLELDIALWKFLSSLAREAGILQ